ncbi:polysaccharide lyase 6 family protein [Cyclobacterium qasimii]|nr:polysaccharide lyase 6 family protein [Cyclobacterium qasimii]
MTVGLSLFSTLAVNFAIAQEGAKGEDKAMGNFVELSDSKWKKVFYDPCTEDWRNQWSLDGQKATITNQRDGMDFIGGPKAFNDAHHAVLWTKQDFKGDLKIEYEYTRLDNELRMVNILYIQATGSGRPGFDKDISAWADKRNVPSMKSYYNNMNALHISYAAFGTDNTVPGKDYIRGRRYMANGLNGTELDNEYEHTGFFDPGVPHKITIIKRDRDIYMHIKNKQKEMLCHFINSKFPPITEGKIGLRHMYTRGARYKHFKVSLLAQDTVNAEVLSKIYEIKTAAELATRLKSADPGDIMVLPAGNLEDWTIDVKTSGTKEAPIIIKGQGKAETIFTGMSSIQIKESSYINLENFSFSNNSGTAIAFSSTNHCSVNNASFTKITAKRIIKIEGNGKNNEITSCHFFKNPSKNIEIIIGNKSEPVETIIRDNLFEDVPPIGGNGRETIQIGQSQTVYGEFEANTLVENNRFIKCSGESEIISNKSSGNRYIGNLFQECEGELVLRGGVGCTIENNRFENCTGGIRLSGKNHRVRNNVMWKSKGSGISLMYGVSNEAPAFYLAVSGCTIENNTIVDAGSPGIQIGTNRERDLLSNPTNKKKLQGNPSRYGTHFDMTIAPYDNIIHSNVIYGKKGNLITADNAPQNIFKDNLAFSPNIKADTDNMYHFIPLEFVDLEAGNLTLKATSAFTLSSGARGKVCEPVQLKKPK